MKKRIALLALFLSLSTAIFANDTDTSKLLFRDYSLAGTDKMGVLSAGLASWTDNDNDFGIGVYLDTKFLLLWQERINLGVGIVIKPPPSTANYRLDVRISTSVTTHLFDWLEVGAWYAPFWGLAGNDDPWGILTGYVFKF